MSRIAPLWTGWARRNRNVPGPLTGASLAGIPFLPDHLGPDARLLVEIAWGADPTGNADLWTWTDITDYAAQDSGLSWQYGRMSESSDTQPASGSMVLFNDDASFSLGGISPNWPNVKQNVPIRIRINPDGTGFRVAFQGNATDFAPGWDITGENATVTAPLAGAMQRLTQGNGKAPRSAPLRYVTVQADPQPDIYYPLTEGPLATVALPFEAGTAQAVLDLTFLDAPPTAAVKIFGAGTLAPWLPNGVALANSSTLRCFTQGILPGKVIDSFSLDCMVTFSGNNPEAGLVGLAIEVYAGVDNVGTRLYQALWFFPFERTVSLRSVNTALDFATPSVDLSERLYDGDPHHIRINVYQSGADTRTEVYLDGDYVLIAATNGVGITLAYPPYFSFWSDTNDGVAVGHAAFYSDAHPNVGFEEAVIASYGYLGNAGDSALERLERLALQDSIPLEILGDTGSDADTAGDMGPQPNEQVVPLMRECEVADWGILHDGLGPGLTYVARAFIENGAAVLTIDVTANELDPEFGPVHNDERLLNKMTARRTQGGEYTYEDTDGPRGTAAVGVYDDGMNVNISAASRIEDFASWAVHLGTSEGYRYPSVTVNLIAVPHLAPAILSLRPGARIDLTGVGQVLRGHSEDDVSLIVEGISMYVDTFRWLVTFQCSRFDLWRIIVLAADSGDTGEFLCHLKSDGSHLQDGVAVGATSLTVVTPSGPVWSTDAEDVPFAVSVGGTEVQVTGVSGVSSPQTFTVDPMPLAKPGNSPIQVWQPPVLRL